MKTRFFTKFVSLLMVVSITVCFNALNVFAASSIAIDGLYDDWSSVPRQEITYRGWNGSSVHVGQIYTDGDYMYVHFKVSEFYSGAMPFGQFTMTINNTPLEMHIYDSAGGYYSCNAQTEPGEYSNLSVGVRGSTTNWNPKELGNEVVYTVYNSPYSAGPDSNGAEFEFKVPMSLVADAYGIHVEDMSVITITNSSLGSEGVSIAGTSSGPVIGVCIAVAMVGLGAGLAYSKKKKDVLKETEEV